MPEVKWTVNSVEGEPTPEGARRVNLSAWYEVKDEFADEGRGIGVSFEVWIPATLRDLDAIAQEAYKRLRDQLRVLSGSIPG